MNTVMRDWFVGGLSLCRTAPRTTGVLPSINPDGILVASTLAELNIGDLQILTVSFSLRLSPEFRQVSQADLRRRSRSGLPSGKPHQSLQPLSGTLADRIVIQA